jgi:hypothetical protein
MEENKTNKTFFWTVLGVGISASLVILSLTLGVGGCSYLTNKTPSPDSTGLMGGEKYPVGTDK